MRVSIEHLSAHIPSASPSLSSFPDDVIQCMSTLPRSQTNACPSSVRKKLPLWQIQCFIDHLVGGSVLQQMHTKVLKALVNTGSFI